MAKESVNEGEQVYDVISGAYNNRSTKTYGILNKERRGSDTRADNIALSDLIRESEQGVS